MSGETPVATHEGVLHLGSVRVRVYQLNNGQRVIHPDDLADLMRAMADGSWTLSDEDARAAAMMLSGRIVDAEWRPLV